MAKSATTKWECLLHRVLLPRQFVTFFIIILSPYSAPTHNYKETEIILIIVVIPFIYLHGLKIYQWVEGEERAVAQWCKHLVNDNPDRLC